MDIQRISAFTKDGLGGNPAGVVITDRLPSAEEMQRIAHEVGYSETAFAAPLESVNGEDSGWRVRYFAPQSEVPFCGHATIALGATLAEKFGPGRFALTLNNDTIEVEATRLDGVYHAVLRSPSTWSRIASGDLAEQGLTVFGYARADLDARIPATIAFAGVRHLVVALKDRSRLSAMDYDLEAGRAFMKNHELVTVAFVVAESATLFHVRNAFASGGVLEDPATGAAAAAIAGALRDLSWPHGGAIEIIQGEDMGRASQIKVAIGSKPGEPVHVSGSTAEIDG